MDRDHLIQEFASSFKKINKKTHKDFIFLFDQYIPFNEYLVLRMLTEQNNLMVSQIAEQLDVSNSHVTTASEKLVKKGFVQRERSEQDRRIVYLSITEDGTILVSKMKTMILQYFKEKLIDVSDEEIQMVIRIFSKVLAR